jgi:hypothetical protein
MKSTAPFGRAQGHDHSVERNLTLWRQAQRKPLRTLLVEEYAVRVRPNPALGSEHLIRRCSFGGSAFCASGCVAVARRALAVAMRRANSYTPDIPDGTGKAI